MASLSARRGFTVLELLIVLAVFGLLATLALVSLNRSRAALRDTQRLSDIGRIQAGLKEYWSVKFTYPVSVGIDLGKPGAQADKLTDKGFVVADDPAHPDDTLFIARMPIGPSANEFYQYRGNVNGYALRFKTESDTNVGPPNVFYAHANGLIDTSPEEK